MNFLHLNQAAGAATSGRLLTAEELYLRNEASRIATAQEARSNPVLALELIRRRRPYDAAMKTLKSRYRMLSLFTMRKMEAVCPGWECMDEEDQNLTAYRHSLVNNDSNGYHAGLRAAGKKLGGFEKGLLFS